MNREDDCSRFPKILMRYGMYLRDEQFEVLGGDSVRISLIALEDHIWWMKRINGGVADCVEMGVLE